MALGAKRNGCERRHGAWDGRGHSWKRLDQHHDGPVSAAARVSGTKEAVSKPSIDCRGFLDEKNRSVFRNTSHTPYECCLRVVCIHHEHFVVRVGVL